MAEYLLIESRDPFDEGDSQHFYDLASGLAEAGHSITLLLVQNGVLPARRCSKSQALTALARDGVEILADEFSLQERGISKTGIADGVTAARLDVAVDMLAAGRKAIWH